MIGSVIIPYCLDRSNAQPYLQEIPVHEKEKYRDRDNVHRSLLPVDRIAHYIRKQKYDHTYIPEAGSITDPDGNAEFQYEFTYKFRMIVALYRQKEYQADIQHKAGHKVDPALLGYMACPYQKFQRGAFVNIAPQSVPCERCHEQYDQ